MRLSLSLHSATYMAILLSIALTLMVMPVMSRNIKGHALVDGDGGRKPMVIDVVSGMNHSVKMKLSDFADSIAYIPLAGMPAIPIEFILNLELEPNDLFVMASHSTGLLRFSRTGLLKNQIGRFGNGPGELSAGSDFSLLPSEKRICFHRNFTHNMLSYTYEGKFLGDLKTDKDRLSVRTIMLSPDRILRIGGRPAPPEPIPPGFYEAQLVDARGSVVQQIASPLSNTIEWRSRPYALKIGFSGERSEVWFKNQYLFDSYTSDTLYAASADGIVPRYFLDKGKYTGPKWMSGLFKSRTTSYSRDFLVNQAVFESDKYLLFRARLQNTCYLMRVKKGDLMVESMKAGNIAENEPYPASLKIPDDIDGGLAFYPEFTNRQGNIWMSTITALDYLEEMRELAKSGKIDLKNTQNRAVALYHQLKEEDNPVVVLVYLKRT